MITLLKRLNDQLSSYGVAVVVKKMVHLAEDLFFDLKYGTDTVKWWSVNEVPHKHVINASPYQPTRGTPFLKLLKKLKIPKSYTFVDIGSGKGKILLHAQEYGFEKIDGVEFSTTLCEIATNNINSYTKKKGKASLIRIINDDVLNYPFKQQNYCLFLFNPFDAVMMSKFIAKIKILLDKNIKMVIIYRNPKYASLFSESLSLFEYKMTFSSDDYAIFSTYELE